MHCTMDVNSRTPRLRTGCPRLYLNGNNLSENWRLWLRANFRVSVRLGRSRVQFERDRVVPFWSGVAPGSLTSFWGFRAAGGLSYCASKMATLLAVNSGRCGRGRMQAVGRVLTRPLGRDPGSEFPWSPGPHLCISAPFSLASGLESRPSPVWMARVGTAVLALELGLKGRGREAWSPGTGRAVLPIPVCIYGLNSCRISKSLAMGPGDRR